MLNDKEDTAAVVTVISPQKGHVQNTISMRAFKLSFVLRIVVNLIKKNQPAFLPPLYCGGHELVIGYDHLLLPFRSRHTSTRQRGWSLRSHNPDNFYPPCVIVSVVHPGFVYSPSYYVFYPTIHGGNLCQLILILPRL